MAVHINNSPDCVILGSFAHISTNLPEISRVVTYSVTENQPRWRQIRRNRLGIGQSRMETRILVADDDTQQRRYISAVLSAAGYSASSVDCGRAAVDRLKDPSADTFDL